VSTIRLKNQQKFENEITPTVRPSFLDNFLKGPYILPRPVAKWEVRIEGKMLRFLATPNIFFGKKTFCWLGSFFQPSIACSEL